MAQKSNGDYYYVESESVNDELSNFALYEDTNNDLVFYDVSNDEEPKYVAGSGFDVPSSRGYQVNGTTVVSGQESGNVSSLTVNGSGTTDGTIEDLSASYTESELENNFAELANQVNGIITTLQNHGLHA